MQDAASMLAYGDPWASPLGYQLDPVQREPICAALNSAILGKQTVRLYLTVIITFLDEFNAGGRW